MNFDTLQKDIQIEFSKHLNRRERNLIKSLNIKEKNITVPFDDFLKTIEAETFEEAIKFLNSFLNKYLVLSSKNYLSYISILQSFHIIDDGIMLEFSDEIANSFKKGTNFEKLGINRILTFKEKFSYRLYQYIKKSPDTISDISVDKLRELLEIKDSYKRFYDIEKNILLPILKDLDENGYLSLLYRKNKSGEYKSAKILGITLEKQAIESSNAAIIDDIMNLISKRVRNFSEIYSLVVKSLAEHGEEYIRKNAEYAMKNAIGNFDTYLKQLLTQNIPIEKPYLTIKKIFKSLFELHMEVLKIAQQESLYPSNLKFLIKIYSLKDGETTICDGKDIYLKITYSKKNFSYIEVFHQNKKESEITNV